MEAYVQFSQQQAMALNNAEDIFEQVNSVYKNRRDMVLKYLEEAGWPVEVPQSNNLYLGTCTGEI